MPLVSEVDICNCIYIRNDLYIPTHNSELTKPEIEYAQQSASRWYWSKDFYKRVLIYKNQLCTDGERSNHWCRQEESERKTKALMGVTQEADTAKVRYVEKE